MTSLKAIDIDTMSEIRVMRSRGMTIQGIQDHLSSLGIKLAYSSVWQLVSDVPGRREIRRAEVRRLVMGGKTRREAAAIVGCAYKTAQGWAFDLPDVNPGRRPR